MTHEELKYKESKLRECFKEKLAMLDVDGTVSMDLVKCVKTYGMLWHLTHQLCLAEEKETEAKSNDITAETMDFKATGLKMAGGK